MDLPSIEKAYRRYSKVYDFVFGSIFHPGRQLAIEKLEAQPGHHVLEVGVGTGLSLPLYSADVNVTGIDLSKEMLQKAKRRVQEDQLHWVKRLEVMDAQNMSFDDDQFDHVVAMYVASVVPDRKKFVSEVQRVGKPGGTIIFLNHFESKKPLFRSIENYFGDMSATLGFYPNISLDDFINETQFEPQEVIPTNFLGYWSLVMGKNSKKIVKA